MKRSIIYYIYLFLGATFTLSISACHTSDGREDFSFFHIEKQEHITESPSEEEMTRMPLLDSLDQPEEREMSVKVDLQFLETNDEAKQKICKLINDQIIELLLNQSSEQGIDEAVNQYVEDVKAEFHSDEVANTYEDQLKGRAEYGIPNVVNYRLQEDVFTGGAHPSRLTTILRFNTETGAFINLDDVFSPTHHPKLTDLLLKKLMADNQVKTLEELQKKGILEMTDLFIPSNFALREDSIEFYYNEYDIAPYAYGPCTICLGYDDVKDLINPTWGKNR